mmetsp:Transcript_30400/g.71414  ORF Transcript_30400/g.71414 Transcript_30400/m.71414 type:complete len:237 (+) Transcript_30400:435-1145(+)
MSSEVDEYPLIATFWRISLSFFRRSTMSFLFFVMSSSLAPIWARRFFICSASTWALIRCTLSPSSGCCSRKVLRSARRFSRSFFKSWTNFSMRLYALARPAFSSLTFSRIARMEPTTCSSSHFCGALPQRAIAVICLSRREGTPRWPAFGARKKRLARSVTQALMEATLRFNERSIFACRCVRLSMAERVLAVSLHSSPAQPGCLTVTTTFWVDPSPVLGNTETLAEGPASSTRSF